MTNTVHNSISHLRLEPATGRLTAVEVIPSGGLSPGGMGILDKPLTLFVANTGDGTIGAFDIGPEGKLTPVPGYPVPAGGAQPHEFSLQRLDSGKTVLYVSTARAVTGFELEPATRRLTPLRGSPFTGFSSPFEMAH